MQPDLFTNQPLQLGPPMLPRSFVASPGFLSRAVFDQSVSLAGCGKNTTYLTEYQDSGVTLPITYGPGLPEANLS